jgi:hypothetical protein
MVKTKKGRQTNNSSGRKRAPSPRPRARSEKSKAIASKLNDIDTTTLADDDPKKFATRNTRSFLALMNDDSSDEDSFGTAQGDTPRKGEDKKRQRFANETEVIEIEKDDSSNSSIKELPNPVRLIDTMDTDSVQSGQAVTIADILGQGPEEIANLQQPVVINKDCRYTLQVKVTACDNPTQFIAGKFLDFFKWLQDKVGKELSVATWDDAKDKQKIFHKTTQLPKVTETAGWTAIFGTWINIKPQQEGTAFLKVRFVTKSPDVLGRRLTEIGELRDEIKATLGLQIGRLPIPCQAVQVSCVGWLFGSNKFMNSTDLFREISTLLSIPQNVRMGISWRAIKHETGKTPPWIDNAQPASALHIDMDWFHAPIYKPKLAKLFKKHGTVKPLGLSLRLVPCFSSDEGKNATQDQRFSAIEMREKQEYLIKDHITVIKTPYILNLDKPTKTNGTMTLRRYLKNLHPQGLVAARLILSVDRAWQENSRETNIVTTKEYAPQVQEAIRNMIPECVHRFGTGTKGWFTIEGLHAFKGVKWDPKGNKSVSDMDIEAMRTVTEDYFGMGEAWRRKKTTARPTMRNSTENNSSTTPAPPNLTTGHKQPATAETLLAELAGKKSDAPSFGDLYKRPHDGDTARTSTRNGADEASLSSHESDDIEKDVTFADIPPNLPREMTLLTDGDASTAKSSIYYRLQRDKSREMAQKSQEESRQLLETLRREREELLQARQELERLRLSSTNHFPITPSVRQGKTGTETDSAGDPG